MFWCKLRSNIPAAFKFLKISVGTTPYRKDLIHENCRRIAAVLEKAQDIRRTGSAALELAQVACGRIDGFFERLLQPWDYAAGVILVQEAGGCVQTLGGSALDPTVPSSLIVTNGLIQNELFQTLSSVK